MDAGSAAAGIAPQVLKQGTLLVDVRHHALLADIVEYDGFDLDFFLILRRQPWQLQILEQNVLEIFQIYFRFNSILAGLVTGFLAFARLGGL
ncbi:hypothetical protein D3C73_1130580 [compost metagenome]